MEESDRCVVEASVFVPEDPPVRNGSLEETKNKVAQAAAASKSDKSVKANKRITGTVKWFNVKDGFGFITRHDTGEDVFVHQSCILRPNSRHNVRSVGEGEVVEFGLIASKVTGPGFKRVKGSAFVRPKSSVSGGGRGRPKSGSSVRSKRGERRAPHSAPGTTNNTSHQSVGDGPIVQEMAQLKLEDKQEEENAPTEVAESVVDPLALEEVSVKEEADEENDDNDDETASVDSSSTVATAESAD